MTEPPKVFARPAHGLAVPMADGSPWPAEGAEVALDQYVRRRIADGDLVEVQASPSRSAAPTDLPLKGGGEETKEER